ncbi:MAG: ribosome-associated translation inhibitor RaiA [Coriobacteriales bacterium]|jgi:putative sigma-54 modulation protein|nr:ribosome-associated translation inhibitor RaiA [Coriobacteriales bacterium]
MDFKVTGRKMQVSDTLREYVTEKLGNAVKVFDIEPMTAEAVLHVEKNRSNPRSAVAEITLRTKGHVIRAEEAAEDMYAAIDLATDKVTRQLRKYKTRILDRHKRHGAKGKVVMMEAPVEAPAAASVEDEEAVVRVKEIALDPLTEDEALMQIDLLGHDFFVYTDAMTGLVNVMYHRKDGGYGVIKPKSDD